MTDRSSRSARQAARLDAALSGLEVADLETLRVRWHALTGRAAPATFRTALLRAAVAYKLQERIQGGLKASTHRLLHRVADAADPARRHGSNQNATPTSPGIPSPASRCTPSPSPRIKPGTRLLRTWQGTTHEVLVGDSEVTYRGQAYRSLSEVARLITGQRWSGPLFFGLKQRSAAGAQRGTALQP